jgi:ubiquinone/menaquinone biosynthesis C-methylase UbiE
MGYVLESVREFDRLERQSTFTGYDFSREWSLAGLAVPPGAAVLDAGCGSGTVTRQLARTFPRSQVTGCDASQQRLERARETAAGMPNVRFVHQDISHLSFPESTFDVVVCRYVMQHVLPGRRQAALRELRRCLKPGGSLCVVDFDGTLYNLYPQPPFLADALERMERSFPVDLRIGRKLPSMLAAVGFTRVTWKIDLVECRGLELQQEAEMLEERLSSAQAPMAAFLGSAEAAQRVKDEYMETLQDPGAVLFYNKFVVTGVKPDVAMA